MCCRIIAIASLLAILAICSFTFVIGVQQGQTEGRIAAKAQISKACHDEGYFNVGLMKFQCKRLFVVEG